MTKNNVNLKTLSDEKEEEGKKYFFLHMFYVQYL